MAKYLLVAVESDKIAKHLRGKLDDIEGVGVVALYEKPVKYCKCTKEVVAFWLQGTTAGRNPDLVVMDQKTGWRVCTICGRMTPEAQHFKDLLNPTPFPIKKGSPDYHLFIQATSKAQKFARWAIAGGKVPPRPAGTPTGIDRRAQRRERRKARRQRK